MRSRNIQRVFVLFTALLMAMLGGGSALAQGKGHGGGGEKHGGGDKHGGEGQSQRQNGLPPGQARKQERNERQQSQREQSHVKQGKQPRYEGPPMQQQTQPQQRQQERNGRVFQNEQRRPEVRQMPDPRVFEQNRIDRGQMNGEARRQQRGNGSYEPFPNSAWPNNYGYERSNEAHERNAQRKAWKDEERALRNNRSRNLSAYAPQYQTYRAYPYYGNSQSVYQYPAHQRVSVLRSLIASVLGLNSGVNNNSYSQYPQAYYGDPYYPANYSGNNYNGYPQYQSYAAAPYYLNYQPSAYGYDPQSAYDPYNADDYSFGQQPAFYTSSAPSGGFIQQLFSKLLALGYSQGYDAGLNARRTGRRSQYNSDPYAYDNTGFIPYSNTLGENRRSLSDGYDLGYNDALNNQQGSGLFKNGIVDLVTAFLGNGLQTS